MLKSRFRGGSSMLPVSHFLGDCLNDSVDQFASSEFFFEDGVLVDSALLFMKSDSNPELRQKLQDYMLQNEANMLPDDMTEEEVMRHFESKYVTRDSLKRVIDGRIAYLKEQQAREASRKEFMEKLNQIDAE